jgi:D-beta-D-heptose 7-phosphate kinase/D-beta-D-heptose 1-phosphate adenosyltransferase
MTKLVFTNGCFDILHAGHIRLLEFAKTLGDVLYVGVNSDESVRRLKGDDRPIVPERDRVAVLRALSCVDEVEVFSYDKPLEMIDRLRPAVYVKGPECRGKKWLTECHLVRALGGEVVIPDWPVDTSTTKILDRLRTCHVTTDSQITVNVTGCGCSHSTASASSSSHSERK